MAAKGSPASRRKGVALIVVLSVLTVISLLGITFVVLNSVERRVARNHLHEVAVRLLTRAGIEDAVSRLGDGRMLGEAFDPRASWIYRGNDVEGNRPDLRLVPIEEARRPSFALVDGRGHPQQVHLRDERGRDRVVGVSGRLTTSPYHPEGSIYSVQVRDLSGSIHLNDGVWANAGNRSAVSLNLARILNALGRHPAVGIPNLGDLVLAIRPPAGFPNWQDCRTRLAAAGVPVSKADRLEPYVTVHAWVDKNVVNPVPLSAVAARHYPVPYVTEGMGHLPVFRRGPGRDHKSQDRGQVQQLMWMPEAATSVSDRVTANVYGADELVPTLIEVVHRAPVNVNTAAEPVLAALLADLKGFYLVETRSSAPIDPAPDDIEYRVTNWYGSDVTQVISRDFHTWEYMGHTYSDAGWMATSKVTENKDYREPAGATRTAGPVEMRTYRDDDSLGQLWTTLPLVMDGDSTQSGVSARRVAAEIVRCRQGEGEYRQATFGGPFRTWNQFHAFCDHLVRVGILDDHRFSDPLARRQGSQALADVLKANFNPNFHANELNLDHNLHLRVDKTDLIVQSTEFCFLPTGYVEIRGVGRLLAPDTGDAMRVVVEGATTATVKVHETYRESTQRHFYGGQSTRATEVYASNNGYAVEAGPEPDNGPLVYGEHLANFRQALHSGLDGYAGYAEKNARQVSGWGYEASGYLALPTCGGTGELHNRNTLSETLPSPTGAAEPWDSGNGMAAPSMIGHFRYDDRLTYNASSAYHDTLIDLFRENAGSLMVTGDTKATIKKIVYDPATCSSRVIEIPIPLPYMERASNFPDPGEENSGSNNSMHLGPYDPTDGTRYRLLRSYRVPGQGESTAFPEKMPRVAPSDLRVDGFYSERHSGLAYWVDEGISFSTRKGSFSFWFKPNFDPALSGKVRTIASVSRVHRANYHHRNPTPFTLYFMPAHSSGAGNAAPAYAGTWPSGTDKTMFPVSSAASGIRGLESLAPSSFLFGVAWSHFHGATWDYEWLPAGNPSTTIIPPLAEMERYAATPTLSSAVNGPAESGRDGLRSHRWSHVTVAWNLLEDAQPRVSVRINGREVGGSKELFPGGAWYQTGFAQSPSTQPSFCRQSFLDKQDAEVPRFWFGAGDEAPTDKIIQNTLRLGEVSTHSFDPFPRNFSSDGTYDELYVWTSIGAKELDSLTLKGPKYKYQQGRYYFPRGGVEQAVWTSPTLRLFPQGGRQPAPCSGETVTQTDAPLGAASVRLLGASWTWYPEEMRIDDGAAMKPVMYDYRDPDQPKALAQSKPCCRLMVETHGAAYPLNEPGGFSDDGYSGLESSDGGPVTTGPDHTLRYKVRFVVEGATSTTVLLATPVFDDVTIYWTGGVEYLAYQPLNISSR